MIVTMSGASAPIFPLGSMFQHGSSERGGGLFSSPFRRSPPADASGPPIEVTSMAPLNSDPNPTPPIPGTPRSASGPPPRSNTPYGQGRPQRSRDASPIRTAHTLTNMGEALTRLTQQVGNLSDSKPTNAQFQQVQAQLLVHEQEIPEISQLRMDMERSHCELRAELGRFMNMTSDPAWRGQALGAAFAPAPPQECEQVSQCE